MPRGKSNNGSATGSGPNLPALVDLRLVKALDHVLRQHILLATVAGEVSPSEMSEALGEGLSQVSYHVKVLRDDCEGMIAETRTEPRRGAVEHYYRATSKTLLPAKAWRQVKKGLRAVVGAGQANDLFNDLADALKAGKLQGTHDHIVRTPLVLDTEGQRKVRAIAERVTREIEDEQQAATQRIADGGGKLVGYTFALLAFEAAWKPVEVSTPVNGDEASASANSVKGAGGKGSRKAGRRGKKAAVKGK